MRRLVSKYRIFNGDAYVLYFVSSNGRVIDNVAANLRKMGRRYRVVDNGYTYMIYVSGR